jgi:PAS domain S-box-containing protein
VYVNTAAVRYHHAQNERELLDALERVFLPITITALAEVAFALIQGEHAQTRIVMGCVDGSGSLSAHARFDCVATQGQDLRVALTIQPQAEPSNLLRAMPDLLFELDANGVYLDFAGPPEDALYPPSVLLGKSVTELLPHDVADRTLIALQRMRETGDPERFEYTLALSDGLHWYEARLSALAHGGAAAYVRDITDQKRAEWRVRESESMLHTMADTAPVMLWMSDRDGECTFCNKGWLEFAGRSIEEERGGGWVTCVHPDDLGRCMDVVRKHGQSHTAFQIQYRMRRRDGEYRWLISQAKPRFSADAQFIGFIGSCFDITDIKASRSPAEAEIETERA